MAETKVATEAIEKSEVVKPKGKATVAEKKNEPVYTVQELLDAADKIFTVKSKEREVAVPKECVIAAFRGRKRDKQMKVSEAKGIVKKFMEREVK